MYIFWSIPSIVFAIESQEYVSFYCYWRICGCQKYKSIHFSHGNAKMCSLRTVVRLQKYFVLLLTITHINLLATDFFFKF